jgi:hypothetical protein
MQSLLIQGDSLNTPGFCLLYNCPDEHSPRPLHYWLVDPVTIPGCVDMGWLASRGFSPVHAG